MRYSAKSKIAQFLADDIGRRDITSDLLSDQRITGHIITKERAVLAGLGFAKTAFRLRGCTVSASTHDGQIMRAGQTIMRVSGTLPGVLSAERTALNLLSRMSGIATQTRELVSALRGTRAKLYATRKTAPGLSFFDKEAVQIGGGLKHRMRLDEMVLIKDNHIAAARASGITLEDLIKKAIAQHKTIEVEVENVRDALCAARAGAQVIMVDNFTPSQVRRAVAALERKSLRKRIKIEASGGIGIRNIRAYAKAGVDMISVGSITSSVRSIDMSLEVS